MRKIRGPIVVKFGGTSVASAEAILTIVNIVKNSLNQRPIVVVSAVSGITEALLTLTKIPPKMINQRVKSIKRIHRRLVNDLFANPKVRSEVTSHIDEQLAKVQLIARQENLTSADLDQLVSYGEIISSYIVCQALQIQKIDAQQVIASDIIVTDDNFMQAEFLPKQTAKKVRQALNPLIKKAAVPVVTGFIAATKEGKTTTLGRGGSDYSASIIAYCLKALAIQIWTDVDGLYTADPRVVKNARLVPRISFREASEMANFGAKILHPRTINPAMQRNIPVRVLNTFNPGGLGTLIIADGAGSGLKAISFKRKIILVNIYSTSMLFSPGFLAKVFEIFAKQNISIDLVSVSEVSISVTLDNHGRLEAAIKQLEKFSTISVSEDFGMISLIGEEVASAQHVIRDVSQLFHSSHIPVRMISMGASNINISLVINSADIEKAVNLIHDQILLKENLVDSILFRNREVVL